MLVQKINEPGSLRTSGAIHMKLAEYDQLTGGIGFPREKGMDPAALFTSRIGGKASPGEKGTERGTDRTRPVRTPFRTFFSWRCFAANSRSEEGGGVHTLFPWKSYAAC